MSLSRIPVRALHRNIAFVVHHEALCHVTQKVREAVEPAENSALDLTFDNVGSVIDDAIDDELRACWP